ncbi:MAG: amidohydrolase family protein, partial [Actinomycetota bacterium]|nr:amidohydrolase family protein [Actinomycetota bacterium]
MSDFVIRGGRVVDPSSGRDEVADVRVEDGVVTAIGTGLEAAEVVDAIGMVVAPGFVDMHTHLREPGREDEETVATASAGAAAGGYTAVCAMPN